MFVSRVTTLIISNEEMEDIMKIVKSLEDSGILIKCVSEKIKNEAKEQKGGFLRMLLGTLSANILGNLLKVKVQLEQVKEQWNEQVEMFTAAPSFN